MAQRWRIGWNELATGCSCPSAERPLCAEADIARAIAEGGCNLYDTLTNLPNRHLFQQRLHQAVHARQNRASVAVLCVDLDRFAGLNEELGTARADQVLQTCAQRLRASVRGQDTVARLDANEFALLVAGHQPHQLELLCRRLLARLAEPYPLDGRNLVITASIGGTLLQPGDDDPEQVLRHAQIALSQAKSEGRATVRWFEPEPDAAPAPVADDELCAALHGGQFELHYQPRVAARSRRLVGVEALLRWRHPTRGLLLPDQFLAHAETDRAVLALDEWALRTACEQARAWPGLSVAVNLSQAQFQGHDPIGCLRRTLADTGLEPERLELEITEDVLLHDRQRALVALWQLKSLGVQIVIDDFGTRATRLGSLLNGPLDKLKIDQSFLYGIAGLPQAENVLAALIGLGRSLGIQTCVAGVETAAQVAWLDAQSCDELQGGYFGQPLPAAEIACLLAGRDAPAAGADGPLTASA